MYNNNKSNHQCHYYDFSEDYIYSQAQYYPRGIKIPPPNNTTCSTNNDYGNIYDDILSFTSDSDINLYPMSHQDQYKMDDDPMKDQQFMAFLSSVSTSEFALRTSSPPVLLFQDYDPQSTDPQCFGLPCSSTSSNMKSPIKKKHISVNSKKQTPAKLGQCEHPKHILYRQEKYTLLPSCSPEETSMMKTVPRRGRPPKGSKTTELYPLSPSISKDNNNGGFDLSYPYPIVELTVRPLPRRLEAVVGRSNVKVCLTCLKRSDTDPDYLKDRRYIGPQQMLKRTKKS